MKDFLEDWGFLIFLIIMIVVFPLIGMTIDNSQKNDLIEACIQSGNHPVIENGTLRECK